MKRKINKNLYESKWNELISNHAEEEAEELYYKFCRVFSLEKYILKYGEEDGKKLYNEKKNSRSWGVTLENCVRKHGDIKGKEVYEKWKKDVSGSLKRFEERYGKNEGGEKHIEFRKRCAIKDKYKDDPNSKWNNREFNTRVEYFIKKYNCSEKDALSYLSERQKTTTLPKLIKKYGKKDGVVRYREINSKKASNIENFIKKYGEIEGQRRYLKYREFLKISNSRESYIKKYGEEKAQELFNKRAHTLKNYINKHGEELGFEKFKSYWTIMLKSCVKYSVFSLNLFDFLYDKLKTSHEDIFYADNEYIFFIGDDDFQVIMVDFYIKKLNKVIEFYGSYWHRDRELGYNDESSKLIWQHDEKRINKLKSKGIDVLIVRELDFVNNPSLIINKCLNFLNYGND